MAETEFGGVDVLINNAGIMKLAKLADVSDDLFERHVAINLKGAFNFMREAAKRMRNGGRVVNISTSVVGTKFETYGVYAATKAALELMSQIMSKEMRGRNILVNAVAPGPTATRLFLDGKSDEVLDRIAKLKSVRKDRHAGGDCGGDRIPLLARGCMGQRPDHPRQRRNDLGRSVAVIAPNLC